MRQPHAGATQRGLGSPGADFCCRRSLPPRWSILVDRLSLTVVRPRSGGVARLRGARRLTVWSMLCIGGIAALGVAPRTSGHANPRLSRVCTPHARDSSLPSWARAGFHPPTLAVPHVLGASGEIMAILFWKKPALVSPRARDHRNKILWVSRVGHWLASTAGTPWSLRKRVVSVRSPVARRGGRA